jgi:hypothetical protein
MTIKRHLGSADGWDSGYHLIIVDVKDNTVDLCTLRFWSLEGTIVNKHSWHVFHDNPHCIFVVYSLQLRPSRIYSYISF